MGYSVSYCGDINVEPSLTEEDAAIPELSPGVIGSQDEAAIRG